MWFKELDGISDTAANLAAAAAGENYESGPICTRILRGPPMREGFHALAAKFRMVGEIEKHHEGSATVPFLKCGDSFCIRKG